MNKVIFSGTHRKRALSKDLAIGRVDRGLFAMYHREDLVATWDGAAKVFQLTDLPETKFTSKLLSKINPGVPINV